MAETATKSAAQSAEDTVSAETGPAQTDPAASASPGTMDSRLIARLLKAGLLDEAGLARANKSMVGETKTRLHLVLTRLGLVAERDMAEIVADELGIEIVGADDYPETPVLADQLGERFLREVMVLPLACTEADVTLAMVDPTDLFARNAVAIATGRTVRPKVTPAADLEAALTRLYETPNQVADDDASAEDIERLKDRASEAPVIRLANSLIDRAAAERASDIHIEPGPHGLDIRFRIDGRLQKIDSPPKSMHLPLLSRLKLMAKLDIAERRLPQDGRISIVSGGREIDLRVATIPGTHGESMVMRLLDRGNVRLELESLGYDAAALDSIKTLLRRRSGIILVTGPTGAGKTTTLYSALRMLAAPDVKLMSVEDPVEYQLEGITQIQMKPEIGLNFAAALRSILRHDPDIVMVGEIRDRETAEIAIQAALTGHLVLSTLHTNSAVATIHRLLDMGVAEYLLAPTVTGIIAQRLTRRCCPACRRAVDQSRAAGSGGEATGLSSDNEVDCEVCNNSGFRGRIAVTEILTMSEPLRQQIVQRASPSDMLATARQGGMKTLRDDGLAKAAAGLTTEDEILRLGLEEEG